MIATKRFDDAGGKSLDAEECSEKLGVRFRSQPLLRSHPLPSHQIHEKSMEQYRFGRRSGETIRGATTVKGEQTAASFLGIGVRQKHPEGAPSDSGIGGLVAHDGPIGRVGAQAQ